MKTCGKSCRGYVLLSFVFLLLMFLGFLGLAVDLGYLFYVRRQMQKATDAAAIGGDHAIFVGQTSLTQIDQAGWNDASVNGFTDCQFNPSVCQASVTVTINNPPTSGPYASDSRAVEAIIHEPVPTLFMKAFGIGTVLVQTRAVAHPGNATTCIFALDPNASGAITVAGNATVISTCGVIDDSGSYNALQVNGTNAMLTATSISVTGNYSGTGVISPTPMVGQPPVQDPLSYLTAPTYNASCDYTNESVTSNTTLYPGVYCGGIAIAAQSQVAFAPGMYMLAGGQKVAGSTYGLYVAGGAQASGNGVTFYNTGPIGGSSSNCAEIYIAGTSDVSLSAPNSGGNYGPYDKGGILFFQDRTCSTPAVIAGNNGVPAGSGYTGALYFAGTLLTYTGTSQAAAYSIVVADKLNFLGINNFNNDYPPEGSPVEAVVLGE